MFKFIARLFAMLTRGVNIIDTNLQSLEELSAIGNDMAKGYRAEYTAQQAKRLEAIERGDNPDAE